MKETKSFRNKQYLDRIQDAKMMKITRPNSLDYKSLSVSDQDEEIFLNAIHRTKKFDFSCCTSDNSFSISITDALQNQVFTIKRKSVCCAYVPCFSCCRIRSQDVIVETSNGELMGTVSDISSFCTTRYEIQSSDEQKLYLIQNGDDFELRHKFNNKFLGITSRSPRHPRQTYDYYMLSFPINLDMKFKITILGALFLLVIKHFPRSSDIIESYYDGWGGGGGGGDGGGGGCGGGCGGGDGGGGGCD